LFLINLVEHPFHNPIEFLIYTIYIENYFHPHQMLFYLLFYYFLFLISFSAPKDTSINNFQ
ncbi:MAG: hypothetical protein Q8806_02635, partial [Candidatus Phytoplasma australasiaticum]|nr:hypothetical protein [Candidatus Phytoplasma australasiaticum]